MTCLEVSFTVHSVDYLRFWLCPFQNGPGNYSARSSAFAVTPFLGDITPFSKPGRRFGNYVASLGRSFAVVNIVVSRPAFRVSSVVIRSVFTNGLSIQT